MKKVLFVVDERKLGGVSVLLESILKNINIKNLDITLLVLHNNGDRFSNIPKGIKVQYIDGMLDVIDLDFKQLLKSFKLIKAIKKLLISISIKNGRIKNTILRIRKKYGISGFDTEVAFKAGFCSLFVACSDSSNKINWIHEDYATFNSTRRYEKTFKKILPLFDKHVVVSNDAAKSFNNIYHQEAKTLIIENYINEKEILKLACELPEHKTESSKLNIVTLARLSYEKGLDRLIEALGAINKELDISKVSISILGNGKMKKTLQEQINKNGLERTITIYENLQNPYSFMKQHDMFIMPSRSESFGMVRIESLILGLPVLTTNVSHTSEIINDKNGIIVENSVDGIYHGLKEVILNPEKVDILKENIKGYSYEKKNTEIMLLIQKTLEE